MLIGMWGHFHDVWFILGAHSRLELLRRHLNRYAAVKGNLNNQSRCICLGWNQVTNLGDGQTKGCSERLLSDADGHGTRSFDFHGNCAASIPSGGNATWPIFKFYLAHAPDAVQKERRGRTFRIYTTRLFFGFISHWVPSFIGSLL